MAGLARLFFTAKVKSRSEVAAGAAVGAGLVGHDGLVEAGLAA